MTKIAELLITLVMMLAHDSAPHYSDPCATVPNDRQLTEPEMVLTLYCAGWPEELITPALKVSRGESSYRPYAINQSNPYVYGLFQLDYRTWARYCQVSPDTLLQAVPNAWCAYKVYQYDISKGHEPWAQWEVKPQK